MSQIWTIDTNKLEALSTSELLEQTLNGTLTLISTQTEYNFTKIRKQLSDTDNIDLYVDDAWAQIAILDLGLSGATINFASNNVGQAARVWLKLFAGITSTTITTLVGYTWKGDDNPSIERGELYSYYLNGIVDNVAFRRYIFNNLETHEMQISVFPEDSAEYGSIYWLYGDPDLGDPPRWSRETSRIAHITGGGDATNTACIAQFLQNGELIDPSSLISIDLSTLSLPSGRHVIQMRLSDDGETHANSDLSAANVYYDVPFNITFNLTNVTQISGGTTINPDATATYVFAPATGYALPDSVTVTGATSTWDQATGTLTLTKGVDTDPVEVTIAAIFMPKLNACSAEFDTDDVSVVIITPDDGNGSATHFAMYDNSVATGVVIPRQT